MKKFITILAVVFISTSTLLAQDGELLDTESGPSPGAEVPVDGGLGLLLAAGVAYGASHWRKPKKKK
jgi:hypothetical protein